MPVMKFVAPDLGFGFAWEPESRNLYIVHENGAPHEQIAASVMTPEVAEAFVGMWCKGYRSRAREIARKPGAKHYHMLAEAGQLGVVLG